MTSVEAAPPLHHIIVVGGTSAEWASFGDAQWRARLGELGKVADHVGARWLVLRPFAGSTPAPRLTDRSTTVGACSVVAQPEPDGRERVAQAVDRLRVDAQAITEDTIAAQLNAPAEVDPDLVVVLGSASQLPTSLVWELAYSELVFLPVDWQHLGAAHLDDAISSYSHRHRRFGGID